MKRVATVFTLVLFFFLLSQRAYAGVVLNEFLPNPSGSEDTEWIEFFNTDSTQVDLSGWQLDDISEGGASPYVIASGTAILSHGFLVFEKSTTGIGLNNDGDTVRLINPLGSDVDTYSYTSTTQDISFGRSTDGTGGWTRCSTLTKGSSNNCPLATPTPTPTPTSSPTSTPTPIPAATDTPSPTPTKLAAPTPTKTPTPRTTATPTPTPETTPEDSPIPGQILGTVNTEATPSAAGLSRVLPIVIPLLSIGMGLAILALMIVWKKRKALAVSQKNIV